MNRVTENKAAQGAKPDSGNASSVELTVAGVAAGLTYSGMCDGSAGAALDDKTFVVATDEANSNGANVLNIYLFDQGGAPVKSLDLTASLVPDPKNKEQHDPDPDNAEADIEGAARIGNRIYWIASHSHSRKGKRRVDRYRFFATDVESDAGSVSLRLAGSQKVFPAYMNLLKDMGSDPLLSSFELKKLDDSNLAPEGGGVNIEGLSATRDNKLLVAFRSPLKDGKALLVPLENPNELIEGKQAQAKFGNPIQLNLGGLGIRDIAYLNTKDTYIILAGPAVSEGAFKLFQWSGKLDQEPQLIKDKDGREINLSGFNPEAIVINPASSTFLILSDDGDLSMKSPGTGKTGENKDLPDIERLFRTLRLALP
jgi:hypothetical protein